MANPIFPGRFSAKIDGDFVVFLIGARINQWWRLPTMWSIGRAMSRMQRELVDQPDLGCLHIENWGGRISLSLQYWRSVQHLEDYARNPSAAHLPAWRAFNKAVRDNGSIGIWHETFLVQDGKCEAIYGNMPRFGLAAAGEHHRLGADSTASKRNGERPDDVAPVQGY